MDGLRLCGTLVSRVGFLALVCLQVTQQYLPLNPQGVGAVPLGLAVNTAVSFVTNTYWQAYTGEATMSYLTQMLGLCVQNSARRSAATIGNYWVDLTRSVMHILLPLSVILALVLTTTTRFRP